MEFALVILACSALLALSARQYARRPSVSSDGKVLVRWPWHHGVTAVAAVIVALAITTVAVWRYLEGLSVGKTGFILIFAVAFAIGAWDSFQRARIVIELDEAGVRQRFGRKSLWIPWKDAKVDAVLRVNALTIRGPNGDEIVVRQGLVGAKEIERFVIKYVAPESIRFWEADGKQWLIPGHPIEGDGS